MASLSVALSYRDAQTLRELAQVSTVNIGFEPNVTVLLPALRQDVLELALARTPTPRQYFTCCVRLSPEKNASLWIDLVEELVNGFDFFAKTGLTPALCAPAGSDNAYATAIVDRYLAQLQAYFTVAMHSTMLGLCCVLIRLCGPCCCLLSCIPHHSCRPCIDIVHTAQNAMSPL